MVVIGDIHVEARRVVDVMHSLDQAIFFECRNGSIDRIERNRFQVLSYLIKYVLGRGMIGMFYQSFENLSPLMGDSQPLRFESLLEGFHHLSHVDFAVIHTDYTTCLRVKVPI